MPYDPDMSAIPDPAAFIRAETRLRPVPHALPGVDLLRVAHPRRELFEERCTLDRDHGAGGKVAQPRMPAVA